jgi:hypothetical protein
MIVQIPGYREAVERETLVRDASFLDLDERIGPFDAVPLTLRHYLILRLSKSPLLSGATPSPDQLAAFLWVVSPGYRPDGLWARGQFLRRVRKVIRHLSDAAAVVDAARSYVAEAWMDSSGGESRTVDSAAYYSDAAGLCSLFAREFGWSVEYTMARPLKQLFQMLKAVKTWHNRKTVLFNPSDKIRHKYLLELNAKLKAAKATAVATSTGAK